MDHPDQPYVITRVFFKVKEGDFPSGPVAKNPCFNSGGLCLIPGHGTRSSTLQGRLKILMCWNQDFMQPNKLIKKIFKQQRQTRRAESERSKDRAE